MIHQPLIMGSGITGQASDIEIEAKEMLDTKRKLTAIYERHTGLDHDTLTRAMDRNNYLSAEAAVEMGLADQVVASRKATEKD